MCFFYLLPSVCKSTVKNDKSYETDRKFIFWAFGESYTLPHNIMQRWILFAISNKKTRDVNLKHSTACQTRNQKKVFWVVSSYLSRTRKNCEKGLRYIMESYDYVNVIKSRCEDEKLEKTSRNKQNMYSRHSSWALIYYCLCKLHICLCFMQNKELNFPPIFSTFFSSTCERINELFAWVFLLQEILTK